MKVTPVSAVAPLPHVFKQKVGTIRADPGRRSLKAGVGPLGAACSRLRCFLEIVEQRPGLDIQAASEAQNRSQARLSRTSLHAADSGRMNVGRVSERVLRKSLTIPKLAQSVSKCLARPFGILIERGGHRWSVAVPRASVQSGLVGSALV
jgi:hypothetical protein